MSCRICQGDLDDARARATGVCSSCWEDHPENTFDADELGIDPNDDE